MTEFETGLPSIRQLQSCIKEKKQVEVKLLTQDTIVGKLLWQDQNCLCLQNSEQQNFLIWWQGIVYIKPL
jgi:host factor-I protein